MEFQVISVIKALFLPPLGFLVLAGIGLVFSRQRWGYHLLSMSVVALLVFSLPWTANFLAKQWESVGVLNSRVVTGYRPQAIVVLGGGIKESGQEYGAGYEPGDRTAKRIRYAAKLARETGLPILVSGGKPRHYETTEAEVMASRLYQDFGLTVRWLEKRSRNTAENARYSQVLLKSDGVERIILVTQAYHMPRALTQFRATGLAVVPAPTDFISNDEAPDIFRFIPSIAALEKNFLMIHEWVGYYWYRLRYR